MNYYVPYFNMYPNMVTPTLGAAANTGGLFSRLLGRGFNWGSILTNTQKTLGIVNQAIPVIKQVSPVVKNAKTMFRVMNEFKKEDTVSTTSSNSIANNYTKEQANYEPKAISNYNDGPTFFLN